MKLSKTDAALLRLVTEMNEREGKPASRYVLEHLMEYGSDDYDVADLQKLLGPRPRRGALFLHLGDLYDKWLVRMGPSGYTVINPD